MSQNILPAICQNPKCGRVFFATNQFVFAPGAGAGTFVRMAIGPCPSCGSTGLVPDGRYGPTVTDVFRPEMAKIVLAALSAIRDRSPNESAEVVIDRDFPFLRALIPYLPKDAGGLSGYLAILISVILWLVDRGKNDSPQAIQLDVKTIEALHSVAAALERNQETKPPPPPSHSVPPGRAATAEPTAPPLPKK